LSNIQIIDPTTYPGWDELLLTNPESSFFHTSAWARVLIDSYGYKPLYFACIENNHLHGLMAVMEIDSFITAKRGVSLPFTDHCPVIARDKHSFSDMFNFVSIYGTQHGWKSLEIRGGNRFLGDEVPSDTFKTHVLELSASKEDVLATFRDSTRRNIKKAQRIDVEIRDTPSMASMEQFYRLNCLTRKDHGLPPQPLYFFREIHKHIISLEKGRVLLAFENKGPCIAGAVFYSFNGRVVFKYGASDRSAHQMRPNNLVMWEAIKTYSQNGSRSFDFGRTDLDHKGLLQFKKGWGTTEGQIHYYNYDLQKKAFVSKYPKIKSSYPVFKAMPMPLLKLIGRVLYRHVG
jgi:hypothetical protein